MRKVCKRFRKERTDVRTSYKRACNRGRNVSCIHEYRKKSPVGIIERIRNRPSNQRNSNYSYPTESIWLLSFQTVRAFY